MEAIFLLCVALSFLFSLFSGLADSPAVLVAMTIAGGGVLCILLMFLQVALVVVTSVLEDKLRVRPKKVPDEVVEALLSEIEVGYQIALQRTGYNGRRLQEKLVELKESVLKQSVNGLWDFDVKANRIRLESLQSTWK